MGSKRGIWSRLVVLALCAALAGLTACAQAEHDGSASEAQDAAPAQQPDEARSIEDAQVAAVDAQTYTGEPITPEPEVTCSGDSLERDVDYTLSYEDNVDVGTATITVTGMGAYSGSASVTFDIVAPSEDVPAVRGPKDAGALQVKGSQLTDEHGEPIQLRGVSTHGLAWFPGYVNDACFAQLRQEWGANVVRLAMYTAESGGYCTDGSKEDLMKLVEDGVRLATDNDLYVIVDWHILSDNDPNMHASEAKEFFDQVSSTFKDSPNVLYEICNEPNGGTTWEQVKGYAEQVIPVIRANDPDAVVLVGSPTWSQDIDKAAANPLSFDNVMYTLHFYAATHKDDLRNRLVDCVEAGLPVFVSEFGICDASGNGTIDEASADSWLATMDKLGVSWCMWSLCNKDESASALKSTCSATSGFAEDDLAASGAWLLKALDGSVASDSAAPDTEDDTGDAGDPSSQMDSRADAVTFESGDFSCEMRLQNSWLTSDGKTCYQYELSITNGGEPCSSWHVTVPFSEPISYETGWNGKFSVKGNELEIANADYNGSLEKRATLAGIGFQVTGSSELAVRL